MRAIPKIIPATLIAGMFVTSISIFSTDSSTDQISSPTILLASTDLEESNLYGPVHVVSDHLLLPDDPHNHLDMWVTDIEASYDTLEDQFNYAASLIDWAIRWIPLVGFAGSQVEIFTQLAGLLGQAVLFNGLDALSGATPLSQAFQTAQEDIHGDFSFLIHQEVQWFDDLLPPVPPPDIFTSAFHENFSIDENTHQDFSFEEHQTSDSLDTPNHLDDEGLVWGENFSPDEFANLIPMPE